MQWLARFLLVSILGISMVSSFPTMHLDEAIESDVAQLMPEEAYEIEAKENLDEKSFRLIGFLNTLSTLGNLVNPGNLVAGNNKDNGNNNGVSASTPRLNGRPGLGIIPDVTKGVNTILSGVASGNLEQILEGSFVFAPNGVQWVAGGVLDRVFLPTKAPAQVPNIASTTTPIVSSTLKSRYTPQQSQLELLKIIQDQQKQINALENTRKSESTTVKPMEDKNHAIAST